LQPAARLEAVFMFITVDEVVLMFITVDEVNRALGKELGDLFVVEVRMFESMVVFK
jgi:hypothetical protein